MTFRKLAAALLLPCFLLAGCGIGAELGFLPATYKGSFIRGDGYAKLCALGGGQYDNAPNGSCPDFLAAGGD